MFAAIYIPDFPVEAMVRAEPELREQAVAVMEGTPPLVHVLAVNERAAQAGVEPGMTRLQAEERLAGGAMRPRSAEREAAAHAALLDCACGFSPRVEDTSADTVVLDLAGLERIFGPPPKMARDMARRCSEMGLEANVAVASNADTAVLAARGFAGVTLIADGREAERLGELSIEVLLNSEWSVASGRQNRQSAIDNRKCREEQKSDAFAVAAAEILDTLERWGVRNLRALAALPDVAVAERLGQDGLRLQKLARGETRRPLVIADPPLVFEEAMELEYPVDLLEPLAFVLNHILEQLCARLAARALAANELKLRLHLEVERDCRIDQLKNCRIEDDAGSAPNSSILKSENSSIHERTLRLPVPMLDAKVFLKLLQLDLQGHPPQAPVTKIWLRAEPAEPRRAQNGLFVPQAPEAERLELTIARMKKVVGQTTTDQKNCRLPIADCRFTTETERNRQLPTENRQHGSEARVGSPEIVDTHRPDGFGMQPFSASGQWSVASGQQNRQSAIDNRQCGYERQDLEGERIPPSFPVTAFRVFRPPLPAVVTVREGCPVHIASPERPAMRGEVVWCAGPWRSSGEWWTEQPWLRQEWDVAVSNEEGVVLYRVYHDEIGGKWFVEGTYD